MRYICRFRSEHTAGMALGIDSNAAGRGYEQ